MPFTLAQLDFLGVHLGVAIPPEFIENKRRAEEFKTRREKLAAQAGAKPADWRLKADFEAALKRAVDSAGQKQFATALGLLDDAEKVLQQPEAPPAPLPSPEAKPAVPKVSPPDVQAPQAAAPSPKPADQAGPAVPKPADQPAPVSPKAADPADAGKSKAVDPKLAEDREKYLTRKKVVEKALQDYRAVLKEAGETAADTDILNRLDGAVKAATICEKDGKFTDAYNGLKDVDTQAAAQSAIAQKRALTQLDKKLIYENKRERIREAITELEREPGKPLPGADKQHKALNALLDKGAAEAKAGNYEAAYKALQGLSGGAKKGAKAVVKFRTTVGGEKFQEQRLRATSALQEFYRVAGMAQADELNQARDKFQKILGSLTLDDDETSDKVKKATKDMGELAGKLEQQTKALGVAESKAIELHNQLDGLFAAILKMADAKTIEELQTPLRAGRTKLGMQNYAGALTDFQAIEKKVKSTHSTLKPTYDKWIDLSAKVETQVLPKLTEIKLGQSETVKFDDARVQANVLISDFKTAESTVSTTRDWAAAAKVAQRLIKELEVMEATPGALADQEKEAQKLSAQAAKKSKGKKGAAAAPKSPLESRKKALSGPLATEVTKVEKRLQDVKDASQPTAALEQRLLASLLRWDKGEKGERDQALQTNLTDLLAQMDMLLNPKRLAQQQPGAPAAPAATDQLANEFKPLVAKAKQVLKALAEEHEKFATPYQTRLDSLESSAKAKLEDSHVQDAKQLVADAEAELQGLARDAAKHAAQAKELAAALDKQVISLRKKNEKLLTRERNKQYEPYFAGLQQKIAMALAMADSPLLTVVDLAIAELRKLKQEFDAFEARANSDAPGVENFAAVDKRLVTTKENLEKCQNLKTCLPSKMAVFKHRLEKEIPGICRSQSPEEALKTLDAFKAEFDAEEKIAKKASEDRTKIADEAKKCTQELEKLQGSPTLKAALVKRITAAATPVENGEPVSLHELAAVMKNITEAVNSPDLRAAMEANSRQAEFEDALQEKRWKGSLAVFEKDTLREAVETAKTAAKKGKINKALYLGKLKPAVDEARKLGKKGNYAEANRKLTEAYRWANEFIANPMSAKDAASSSLKELKGVWRNAVATLVKDITGLKGEIKKEADNDGTVDAKPVYEMLDRLAGKFDPTAFDHVLTKLSENDPTVPRKPLKEQGLRYLSGYQSMLKEDPTLAHIVDNPFKDISLRQMRDTLAALDLNLQRA